MRADEFLARLQQIHDGKELVELLVQAGAVAPPLKCPFPPEPKTKLCCMNNTPYFPAGTRATVYQYHAAREKGWYDAEPHWYDGFRSLGVDMYKIRWELNRQEEIIDKQRHDLYGFVYVY